MSDNKQENPSTSLPPTDCSLRLFRSGILSIDEGECGISEEEAEEMEQEIIKCCSDVSRACGPIVRAKDQS